MAYLRDAFDDHVALAVRDALIEAAETERERQYNYLARKIRNEIAEAVSK